MAMFRNVRRRPGPRRKSSLSGTFWPFQYRTAYRVSQIPDTTIQYEALVNILEKSKFNWRVFFVASSGFLTDSYNLFASNVILPSLAYVYLSETDRTSELTINALTLSGSACGQVLFGFLADVFGRQRLYGVELVIVIFATLGLAASGPGYVRNLETGESSMSPIKWIMFWRFIMGVGIGAEYPLSACITTEWSSKRYRAQMMSAVFMMQPLGQLLAYIVGLAALHGLSTPFGKYQLHSQEPDGNNSRIGIDILWRIVAGVGGIPALIALIFRWTIPESPRYTWDIKRNSVKAVWDTAEGTTGLFSGWSRRANERDYDSPESGDGAAPPANHEGNAQEMRPVPQRRDFVQHNVADHAGPHSSASAPPNGNTPTAPANPLTVGLEYEEENWSQFTRKRWSQYFHDGDGRGGNWRNVFGVSVCWAFLDFVFYGLGFNDPGTLARLWTSKRVYHKPGETPSWLLWSVAINGDHSIFTVLKNNAVECIATVSVWALLGCALMTYRINGIDRKLTLVWSSILLAGLLLATAIAFPYCFHEPSSHVVLIVLYASIQFCFSYGPNTLLFIIPGELFPTRYRATCYGIAAASGKTGAALMQLTYQYFDNRGLKDPNSPSLGYLMYLFSGCMLVVAVVGWIYIPDVQTGERERRKGIFRRWWAENISLEELAKGRSEVDPANRVGFLERMRDVRAYVKERFE